MSAPLFTVSSFLRICARYFFCGGTFWLTPIKHNFLDHATPKNLLRLCHLIQAPSPRAQKKINISHCTTTACGKLPFTFSEPRRKKNLVEAKKFAKNCNLRCFTNNMIKISGKSQNIISSKNGLCKFDLIFKQLCIVKTFNLQKIRQSEIYFSGFSFLNYLLFLHASFFSFFLRILLAFVVILFCAPIIKNKQALLSFNALPAARPGSGWAAARKIFEI